MLIFGFISLLPETVLTASRAFEGGGLAVILRADPFGAPMSPYSRPPTSREAYAAGVESELAEERAQTLGRAGRSVEQAMAALRASSVAV